MNSVLIVLVFYIVLLVVDLIPLFKSKKKKILYLFVPVYLITLTLNIIYSLGGNLIYLGPILQKLIISIFHLS
jgi:hypothetical protein